MLHKFYGACLSDDPKDILNHTARDLFVGALTPITLRKKVLDLGSNTLHEALQAARRYESNQKVLIKTKGVLEYCRQLPVSKRILVHNREPTNPQGKLRNSLNNKRKYWRSLKIFHKGGKAGTKAWSLDRALEHVLSVVV